MHLVPVCVSGYMSTRHEISYNYFIHVHIFNSFLFTCASIILLRPFFAVFIFSFIYFFGKRSVSWFPQRDDVEYCTVNGDEKRPMTRTHTPASSTLQYATELTREIARRNWTDSRDSALPESLPLPPRNREAGTTRGVLVCACVCTVVARAWLCALFTWVSIGELMYFFTSA